MSNQRFDARSSINQFLFTFFNYLSRWCSWWAKTNAQWTYQQLLIEFIQTTHQAGLRFLAKALLDEQFDASRAVNGADRPFLAQVTL
ncbi:TPA: hypothetical protein JBJ11_05560 [Legionella pneumophila]|nr:hypothetical protein [Legionella pneumophila]HAU1655980.1 hypothetical protein [Legionella pneumophila]